jgi:hypothetical protein
VLIERQREDIATKRDNETYRQKERQDWWNMFMIQFNPLPLSRSNSAEVILEI